MRDYSFVFEEQDVELRFELIRQLGKSDLFFLAKHILGYADLEETTDVHHKLCDILQERPERQVVLMARGMFKTSLGIAWLIQCLINIPDVQIGIGSDTKERAEERLLALRTMVSENELLKSLYSETFYTNPKQESDLFRNDSFNVKRSPSGSVVGGFRKPSVSAFGLDPLPTGSHYDIVLIDDVENEANCDNEELVDKLVRNFRAFMPTLNVGAKLVLLGTIYAPNGPNTIYQNIWPTYKRPIIDQYGQPTFPSRFSLIEIEKYRRDISDDWLWSGQYLLKSTKRIDKFFYPFHDVKLKPFKLVNGSILYTDGQVRLSDCIIYLLCDPGGGASKEQKERQPKVVVDTCGFCLLAADVHNNWFVLRMWREYLSDEQFVDRLFSLYDEWRFYIAGIEKMPHLDSYLRLSFRTKGRSLPIAELLPKRRPKEDRIRASKPMLNTAYFIDEQYLQIQQHFRNWYTEQEHEDDDIDAWAYALDIVRPPTSTQLSERKKILEQEDEKVAFKALPPAEREEWEYWQKLFAKTPETQQWEKELEEFLN